MKKMHLILLTFPFLLSGCLGNPIGGGPVTSDASVSYSNPATSIDGADFIILKPRVTWDINNEVEVLPSNADGKELVITSDDDSVVHANEDGTIYTRKIGDTCIHVAARSNPNLDFVIRICVEDEQKNNAKYTSDGFEKVNNPLTYDFIEGDELHIITRLEDKKFVFLSNYLSSGLGYGCEGLVDGGGYLPINEYAVTFTYHDMGSDQFMLTLPEGQAIGPNQQPGSIGKFINPLGKCFLTFDLNYNGKLIIKSIETSAHYYFGYDVVENRYGFYDMPYLTKESYKIIYGFDIYLKRNN